MAATKSEGSLMTYFFSQQMTYCECMMPRESGWEVMNQLGKKECVHFSETTIDYGSPYIKSLKRCEESVAKLAEIKKFIRTFHPKFDTEVVESYDLMFAEFEKSAKKKKITERQLMNEIEEQINSYHQFFIGQKKEQENLKKQLDDYILQSALLLRLSTYDELKHLAQEKQMIQSETIFDFRCIIINRQDQFMLERGLFRISRGNICTTIVEIDHKNLDELSEHQSDFLNDKVIAIFTFQPGETKVLKNKIDRFLSCLDFTENTESYDKWGNSLQFLLEKIKEVKNLIHLTKETIDRKLDSFGLSSKKTPYSIFKYLEVYAVKERQIYRQLASTTVSKNFLHFNIYIATKDFPLHVQIPQNLPPLTLIPKQPPKSPPTRFDTPEIMQIPQQIVNTYGTPTYGQFNPAPLYIVTFSFFIGVMFGDVGHMLMIIPFLLYYKANPWTWTLVLFMGYCGIIYNEFFGLNLGLFKSCYDFPTKATAGEETGQAIRHSNCVYPFGVDSIWKLAQNQMQFTNSMKMKIAVILGVIHMMLGLFIRVINNVRGKRWLQLFTLTIPQIIFMTLTFVYMDFLIIDKWLSDYTGANSKNAPSIISIMIGIYAGFGQGDGLVLWAGEKHLQSIFLAVTALMIPIMLFGVPIGTCIQRRRSAPTSDHGNQQQLQQIHKPKLPKNEVSLNQLIDPQINSGHQNEHMALGVGDGGESSSILNQFHQKSKIAPHQEEPIRQILVHQFIETIEYVLGTVSNTASYLRLWALSLAHGQLSQVIFELILKGMMSSGYMGIIGVMFVFPFFYLVTFGVLICMDSMECFLHSLRLHWVEFQNKFYAGKGYLFEAFSFKNICKKLNANKI